MKDAGGTVTATMEARQGPALPSPRRAVAMMLLPTGLLTIAIVAFVAARGGAVEEAAIRAALPWLIAASHTVAFLVLLVVLGSENRSLRHIGWRSGGRAERIATEAAIGLAAALVLYLFKEFVLDSIRAALAGNQPTFTSLFRFSLPAGDMPMLFTAVLFPAVEESVYRGYGLPPLEAKWGRPIGLAAMAVLFGVLHWGNGPLNVAFAAVLGLAFAVLFLWRRTLLAATIAHAGYNALVLLN